MVRAIPRGGWLSLNKTYGQNMETFSINRLAELTAVDRRTLKKYLSKYAPDKKSDTREEYSFKTAAIALSAMPSWKAEDAKGGETDPAKMDPKDRKDWYDAENKRLAYESALRELIPVDEVRETVAEAFKIVVFALDTLPDRIEHEVGLQADQLKVFLGSIDDARQSLAHNLQKYMEGEDEQSS